MPTDKKLNLKIRQRKLFEPNMISQSSKIDEILLYDEMIKNSSMPQHMKILTRIMYERGLLKKCDLLELIHEKDNNNLVVKEEQLAYNVNARKPFNFDDDYSIPVEEYERYIPTSTEYDFSSWVLFSNIKRILEERGLKQSWLQERTQIPLSTLRSILNNEKAVTLENALKISIVMEMPINTLFTYIDIDSMIVGDEEDTSKILEEDEDEITIEEDDDNGYYWKLLHEITKKE